MSLLGIVLNFLHLPLDPPHACLTPDLFFSLSRLVPNPRAQRINGLLCGYSRKMESLPRRTGEPSQKTLETFGTPVGAAGGSSASITVFLFESMLSNPIVAALDTTEKKEALALPL
jgi:hypothetical protein